jgi:hypothetical protein
MRRNSLSGVGAALVLVLGLLLPAVVQGDEVRSPSVTGFRLEASNGYEFLALAGEAPPEGDEGWIGLFLVRGDRHAAVTYAAPATVMGETIDADFGKLGRISVTRVPTGRTRTAHLVCGSESRQRVKAERYEGTIEFHGEAGFTEVSATSAPLVYPPPCGIPEGGRPAGNSLPGARLGVEKEHFEQNRFDFNAVQNRPGARTEVGAEVEEHRGEMEIHRATWTWANADVFHYDRRLRTATVRPPDPFSGHGSFRVSARGPNLWTGNLTVDLPGRSEVPLTGPGFRANLEHARR